ncbi:MAG: ABC transporter ATP-binding protein, partial [Rhodobacteraceae bacterium]|nr:ABC transporter ATP-binding protein [Paracoccaceae bacterium]
MSASVAGALSSSPPAAGGAPLVSLTSISKTFSNGTVALRDLSLDIGERQFVSLLGPSGCGKSTVLRIIAGLGDPTAGTVTWPASADRAASRHQREIGFVFQEPTLMPWATAFNNVWLPLRLRGVAKTTARDQ